jgi:hypothetical protein
MVGLLAVTVTVAGSIVKVVAPLMEPDVAVIVVLPTAKPFAEPVALIVATEGTEELHVAVLVRFWVLPSLYVPVAVKGSATPKTTAGLAGVTAMETSAGSPTVTVVEPHTAPAQALTVAEPAASAA